MTTRNAHLRVGPWRGPSSLIWLGLALTGATLPTQAGAAGPSALEQIVLRQGGRPVPVAGPRRGFDRPIRSAALLRTAYVRPAAFLPRGDGPDVFGSVAVPISRTPLDARWRQAAGGTLPQARGGWARLLDRQRGAPAAAQLASVNAWVNAHVTFTADRATSGRADRWATAAETLASRRGDCEDYAIAKLQLLKRMGFAANDLFLVIAHDLVRRQDHAVLVVRSGGDLLMLDSGTDELIDARQMSDYRPIMTFSGARSWTHGYAVAPKDQFADRRAPALSDPS